MRWRLTLVIIACSGALGWAGLPDDPYDRCILDWYVTHVYAQSPGVREVMPGLSAEARQTLLTDARTVMAETQMDGLRRLYEQHVRQGVRPDACPPRAP